MTTIKDKVKNISVLERDISRYTEEGKQDHKEVSTLKTTHSHSDHTAARDQCVCVHVKPPKLTWYRLLT